MTPGEAFWFIVGLPTGVLLLMTAEVAHTMWGRRGRHPMSFDLRFPPPTSSWDVAFDEELLPRPTPRAVTPGPVLATCPDCGRGGFKRLAQHQRMAHPGVAR